MNIASAFGRDFCARRNSIPAKGRGYVLAVVACTVPRCAWHFPSKLGPTVLLGACLFLIGHTVFRALDWTDKSPRWAPITVGVTALAVAGWVIVHRRSVAPLPDVLAAAPWMAASLLIFCLFFSQAFINYFYLCQYLLLLGLPDWFALDLGTSSAQSHSFREENVNELVNHC